MVNLIKKYYGEYIIGKESDWISFCSKYNYNWIAELKPTARKGVNQFEGEDVYLVELWHTDERMIDVASKYTSLFVLKQHLASQLGINSIYELVDKDGNSIWGTTEVDGEYTLENPWALINIYYSCDSSCPTWFDTEAEVIEYLNGNHDVYGIPRLAYLNALLNVFVVS